MSRNQAEHQRNADIPSDAEFARESRGNAAESQFSRINEAIWAMRHAIMRREAKKAA